MASPIHAASSKILGHVGVHTADLKPVAIPRDIPVNTTKSYPAASHSNHPGSSTGLRSHGEVSDYRGQIYKWHQIAVGMWQGISLDQWNDSIHVKNDTSLDPFSLVPAGSSNQRVGADVFHEYAELNRKSLDNRACQLMKTCTARAIAFTVYHIAPLLEPFISAVSQYGPDVWKFLNQPVVVAITVGSGTAALGGAVSAWTTASITASQCSDTRSDADVIRGVIDELISAHPYRTVQGTLQVGKVVANISMEAIPSGQEAGKACERPPGNLLGIEWNSTPVNELQSSQESTVVPKPLSTFTNGSKTEIYLTRYENFVVPALLISVSALVKMLKACLAKTLESGLSLPLTNRMMLSQGNLALRIWSSDGRDLTLGVIVLLEEKIVEYSEKGFTGLYTGYIALKAVIVHFLLTAFDSVSSSAGRTILRKDDIRAFWCDCRLDTLTFI